MRTPIPLGSVDLLDDTRAGHEVHFRIFRTDAAFDGVSPLLDVLLSQLQYLSVGYLNLFFYQIYADYFFCDGMFHLQAGVHFQKVIIAVLVHQEFNGSRADVVHGLGSGYCLSPISRRSSGVIKTEGLSSTIFWLRRCTEHSRSHK